MSKSIIDERTFTISQYSFRNSVIPLTTLDYKVWDFMKQTNIKSMNVRYIKDDTIAIELDSIKYN